MLMVNMRESLLNILRRSLVLALLLLTSLTLALAERRERAVDAWRPIHYDVSLTLDDKLTEITRAETKIKLQVIKGPLNVIDLDFGQMTVDSVKVVDAPARFEQVNGRLDVQLPEAVKTNDVLTIAVSYHGRPQDGLILMNDKAGSPSATGDNWPDRVHHWIPCLDHPSAKATVNFTVTTPARYIVVANGQLMATRNNAGTTRTWTYTESRPIPPYCMIIAVGEYAQSEPQPNTSPPLSYYVPQTDRDFAVRGFSAAPAALQFFSERVAPFPYEKLALIVGATRFGGMENSSAIVFSGNLFNTPVDAEPLSRRFNIRRSLVEVTAHELAHQWFGDSVSIKTWADLWLSEGFADYFAGLFIERYEGKDAFRDYMRLAAEKYFNYARSRRAPVYDTETENLSKLLNPNTYEKGAWVLHMLRARLGDAAFFKGIRAFYLRHEHKAASTEDLRAAMEKASGVNLKEFFARWVYASGHPHYEISWSWQSLRRGRGMLNIHLRQTQTEAPFLTPLPIEIVTARGAQRVLLKPVDRETNLRIPLLSKPTDVRVDPDEAVLKELVVPQANRQIATLYSRSQTGMDTMNRIKADGREQI
jgi:aminopeptidase N